MNNEGYFNVSFIKSIIIYLTSQHQLCLAYQAAYQAIMQQLILFISQNMNYLKFKKNCPANPTLFSTKPLSVGVKPDKIEYLKKFKYFWLLIIKQLILSTQSNQ